MKFNTFYKLLQISLYFLYIFKQNHTVEITELNEIIECPFFWHQLPDSTALMQVLLTYLGGGRKGFPKDLCKFHENIEQIHAQHISHTWLLGTVTLKDICLRTIIISLFQEMCILKIFLLCYLYYSTLFWKTTWLLVFLQREKIQVEENADHKILLQIFGSE